MSTWIYKERYIKNEIQYDKSSCVRKKKKLCTIHELQEPVCRMPLYFFFYISFLCLSEDTMINYISIS